MELRLVLIFISHLTKSYFSMGFDILHLQDPYLSECQFSCRLQQARVWRQEGHLDGHGNGDRSVVQLRNADRY